MLATPAGSGMENSIFVLAICCCMICQQNTITRKSQSHDIALGVLYIQQTLLSSLFNQNPVTHMIIYTRIGSSIFSFMRVCSAVLSEKRRMCASNKYPL